MHIDGEKLKRHDVITLTDRSTFSQISFSSNIKKGGDPHDQVLIFAKTNIYAGYC
jgi:hypothetical protein